MAKLQTQVVALPPIAPRRPAVPVAVLAARTLSLATLGPRRRAERRAQSVAELEALAGASLLELRQKLPTRYWLLAMLSLTGKSVREIAALVGYAGPAPVLKALRHPAVARLVEEVRAAQLEAITSGSFGVAAQAKKAAPAIAEHLVELAGGKKDAGGQRLGRARRDADAIRAADLMLTISGDKVERQASLHLAMLEELSNEELEAYAARGELPARYQGGNGLLETPASPSLSTSSAGAQDDRVNMPPGGRSRPASRGRIRHGR